jgi:hypothetical protein
MVGEVKKASRFSVFEHDLDRLGLAIGQI